MSEFIALAIVLAAMISPLAFLCAVDWYAKQTGHTDFALRVGKWLYERGFR